MLPVQYVYYIYLYEHKYSYQKTDPRLTSFYVTYILFMCVFHNGISSIFSTAS